MSARKRLPKEAQDLFDKYTKNFNRKLKKDVAIQMLQEGYKLTPEVAELVFDTFVMDGNIDMRMWEYQQFYWCIGENIQDILQMYEDVKKDDGSGNVDMEKTWNAMKEIKTMRNRVLEDTELEKFIMKTAGEEKTINLPKFLDLVVKIKQYRG